MSFSTEVHRVISELNKHEVRYLVVGGIAVNLHGWQRSTTDIDVITDLSYENLQRFGETLRILGYSPRQPIKIEEASDPKIREQGRKEKNAVALFFQNNSAPYTAVDILYNSPLDFEQAYEARKEFKLNSGDSIKVCSLEHLIQLKRQSSRKRDMDDVEALEAIAIGRDLNE